MPQVITLGDINLDISPTSLAIPNLVVTGWPARPTCAPVGRRPIPR